MQDMETKSASGPSRDDINKQGSKATAAEETWEEREDEPKAASKSNSRFRRRRSESEQDNPVMVQQPAA